jgi:hypothetical protein
MSAHGGSGLQAGSPEWQLVTHFGPADFEGSIKGMDSAIDVIVNDQAHRLTHSTQLQ